VSKELRVSLSSGDDDDLIATVVRVGRRTYRWKVEFSDGAPVFGMPFSIPESWTRAEVALDGMVQVAVLAPGWFASHPDPTVTRL
jgi:hypothetical protein